MQSDPSGAAGGGSYDALFKLVLIGDSGVGKVSTSVAATQLASFIGGELTNL